MLRSIWTSKSGMNAQQIKLDTIGNNIANSNTIGYKRIDVGFKDLLSESLDRKGNPLNDKDATMGTGVKTSDIFRDDKQGNLMDTGIATDLSIDGEGYFRLTDPQGGYVYTRDGAFQVDRDGRIVNQKGDKLYLQYVNGRSEENCHFTPKNMLIDTSGNIFIKEGENFEKVAEIPLFTAVGNNAFNNIGNNLYTSSEGAVVERTRNASIYQGFLENSNVDIATEFTDMILTQRSFQLSSKSLQTADEMWGMINNMRR